MTQDSKYFKEYRHNYVVRIMTFIFIVGFGVILINCKDNVSRSNGNDELNININIPLELEIVEGGNIILPGKGFAEGDQIRFISSFTDEQYLTDVSSVTGEAVTFPLPYGVISGDYSVTVIRGTESLEIGSLYINIVADIEVADLSGMTVKGVVHCEGVGIPDVVVSDGFELTTTDDNGIYYLPSQKRHGYVFVSVPGNYEVANDKNAPQFFKRLKLKDETTAERRDFSLIKTNNTKHVVIGIADLHLSNQNDDLSQFSDGFLPDVNSVINDYQTSGFKVYCLTLGDMTWESQWTKTNFALPEYVTYMNKIGCPVFNVMGNHDNDPFANSDWSAENLYRDIIGPTYYSFNLGDIHYIVLDDIEYINTGANPDQGVMGQMNYAQFIVSRQLEWLKKDLATIKDKNTPIVIAMHSPLYREPTLDNGLQKNSYALSNQSSFLYCIKDFTNVEIISGHIHVNYSVRANEYLMERNIAAVCGTWWWTGNRGYAGNQICRDGSPTGYSVWEMDGRNMEWYYKSIGYERDYQFRSYDLNSVHITAEKYAPNSTWHASRLEAYTGEYAFPNNRNEVLINVWGYDELWDVEVKENNQALDVTRVVAHDPLHLISYVALRIDKDLTPNSTFSTRDAAHMFKATASSPTSTLEIKVTDCFGNVYTESMTRPKELTYLMK